MQLLSGRAKFAEHYPEALVNAILKAVREELRNRCLLNFDDTSSGSRATSRPSSLLPHVDEDSLAVPAPESWDEIAGTKLDSKLVQNARAEEIQWMQSHGQWEVVPIYEAKAAGQRLIEL